ncbi:MAG TPA: hypothetical protein VKG25_16745 [Bryobacteraceae bacterium]|nr:hypothetical protein [Bryobacteraceae bacterium]
MALIEINISMVNGTLTIVPTIKRLDPSDEIHLISNTANAALKFNDNAPFRLPGADNVYMLPQPTDTRQPLQLSRSIDVSDPASDGFAQCGQHINGEFQAWLQSGGGFPPIKKPSGT